jgi:VanZ family protein
LSRRFPSREEVAIAAVLLVVLVITLLPSRNGTPLPVSFALGEGRRWLADGILNLCLFVPVGFTLMLRSRSPFRAIGLGLVLSTAIEIAQVWIPGRDPALSDLVFNTAGTALGALLGLRPRSWLSVDARNTVGLMLIGVALATALMTITVVLLEPTGPYAVDRTGRDLMLQYQSRADVVGLDQPVYWLANAFSDSLNPNTASMSVRRERARWYVSVPGLRATLGPTVGEGWTLLGYPDAIAKRWSVALDALWMLLICLPAGFWARSRAGFGAACLIAFALWLVPILAGVVPTPLTQWIGAAAGLIGGAFPGWLSRRWPRGSPADFAQ